MDSDKNSKKVFVAIDSQVDFNTDANNDDVRKLAQFYWRNSINVHLREGAVTGDASKPVGILFAWRSCHEVAQYKPFSVFQWPAPCVKGASTSMRRFL